MSEETLLEATLHAVVLATNQRSDWAPGGPHQPAALLSGLGLPLIQHTLRWLDAQQLAGITVVSHERPYVLAPHVASLQTPVRHWLERQTRGTVGILRQVAQAHPGTLLIVEGPLRTELNLQALWCAHRRTGATMTCGVVSAERAPGALRVVRGHNQRIVRAGSAEDLPSATEALAGLTLLETSSLEAFKLDESDYQQELLCSLLAGAQPVFGVDCPDAWNAAWSPQGYAQFLQARLVEQREGVYVAPGARVDPRARLIAPCYIAAGSRIEAEAEVGPAVCIEAHAQIGRGSRLQHCQVLPYTRVSAGSRWKHGVIFPHGFTPWGASAAAGEVSEDLDAAWQPPWGERLHTLLDQSLAALLLLLMAPLWLLIIAAIKLDSPGPAFYTQLRSGRDPRPYRLGSPRGGVFACYKFRTMHADADRRVQELRAQNQYGEGAFFKLADDPRITRVGSFLRKTSLDELPQLINVLKGEMRLVGNRPLPLYEAEALQEDWQRTRFLAPAGITGLWQISGRSELSEKERLVLDAYYSVTRSFWGDWGILLRTLPALIRQRGAR